MTKSSRTLGLLLLMLGMLALAACESEADKEEAAAIKEKKETEAVAATLNGEKALPICPQVAIVRGLDTVKDYGNEGPAPDKFVAGARMLNVDGNCSYVDEDDKQGVDITFELAFIGERGPRLESLHAKFPFFVAVIDPAGAILNKDNMTTEVNFSSDSKTAQASASLHVFIPLPKDKRDTGPSYQVLMGFQLTKEQLAQTAAKN